MHLDFPKKQFIDLFILIPPSDICSFYCLKYIGEEKPKLKEGFFDIQYYFWRIYFQFRNNRKDSKQLKSNFIYI